MPWTREDAVHLLRRTGFGGELADVELLYDAGQAGAIEHVLNYRAIPDPEWSTDNPLNLPDAFTPWAVRRNLLYRLITGPRSLQSRMIWFWHNHFTTHIDVAGAYPMWQQILTLRANALGKFQDLLLAIHKDTAMLRYLNGDGSTKERPNENFARECMELFTCGPSRFSENDVREAARAFTGWMIPNKSDGRPGTTTIFNPAIHDAGQKTILGRTGNFDGDDVMRLLFSLPETSQRICTKLYHAFIGPQINQTELDSIVEVWKHTDGDVRKIMTALLTTEGFWDPSNRQALMKNPLQFCLGMLKGLGFATAAGNSNNLVGNTYVAMQHMGHEPFSPPNVAGYPSPSRCGGSNLVYRYRYAYYVLYGIDPEGLVSRMLAGLPDVPTKETLIAKLPWRIGLPNPSPATVSAIRRYLDQGYGGEILSTTLKEKVLGTLYLLACSPEYQMV